MGAEQVAQVKWLRTPVNLQTLSAAQVPGVGRLPHSRSGLSCLRPGRGRADTTRSPGPGPAYFSATFAPTCCGALSGTPSLKGPRPAEATVPSQRWKLGPERPRGLPRPHSKRLAKQRLEPGLLLLNRGSLLSRPHRLWLHLQPRPLSPGPPPASLPAPGLSPRPSASPPSPAADEFGNQFEVNNCSSCYHWVTAKPEGQAVFSADYKGCHVLAKVGLPPLWGEPLGRAGRPLRDQGGLGTPITQ